MELCRKSASRQWQLSSENSNILKRKKMNSRPSSSIFKRRSWSWRTSTRPWKARTGPIRWCYPSTSIESKKLWNSWRCSRLNWRKASLLARSRWPGSEISSSRQNRSCMWSTSNTRSITTNQSIEGRGCHRPLLVPRMMLLGSTQNPAKLLKILRIWVFLLIT